MNRLTLTYLVPLVIAAGLLGLLGRELFHAKPNELPSALIGEPLPDFNLSLLFDPSKTMSAASLRTHHVVLLNVWATWCYACSLEQPMLMKIHQTYHVPLYSLDYKDTPLAAKQWLAKYGNPFDLIASDREGDVAIDLGVYGTPETFVIGPQGTILYRHIGIIDQTAWDTVLFPLIKKYSEPSAL